MLDEAVSYITQDSTAAAHGPTQEAALASGQEAVCLWIDTAREFGDPIPEPRARRLIFA